MHKVSALGIVYSKLNAVYVCNGTMDLSRNSVFNVKVGQNKETQLFLFIYCSNSNNRDRKNVLFYFFCAT